MESGQKHRDGFWVFSYGSLMWRPEFPYVERHLARLPGYERDMCILSIDHRGTRARPGLVAGLREVPGSHCDGAVYLVAPDKVNQVREDLEKRENFPEPCYSAEMLKCYFLGPANTETALKKGTRRRPDFGRQMSDLNIDDQHLPQLLTTGDTCTGLVYIPLHGHPQFAASLGDDDKLAILAGTQRGRSGTSLQYLEDLVTTLASQCGIEDVRLRTLLHEGKSAAWKAQQRTTAEACSSAGLRHDSEGAFGGSVFTPIFGRSVIAFSWMNEDYRVELQLINRIVHRRKRASRSARLKSSKLQGLCSVCGSGMECRCMSSGLRGGCSMQSDASNTVSEDIACIPNASEAPAISPGWDPSEPAPLLGLVPEVGRESRLRVACIASSGETALALAACSEVATVIAVDMDEWQVHLAELKRAAMFALPRHEQLRLYGMDPAYSRPTDFAARLDIYRRLRASLPAYVRDAWDSRREKEIAFGIGHCGRSDVINHDLAEALAAIGKTPWQTEGADDLPYHSDFRAAWAKVYSYENFSKRFGTLHVGQAAMNEMVASHHAVLQRPEIAFATDNYFFSYFYTNYFVDAIHGLPMCLSERGQARIKALGALPPRLSFHVGPIDDVLEQFSNGTLSLHGHDAKTAEFWRNRSERTVLPSRQTSEHRLPAEGAAPEYCHTPTIPDETLITSPLEIPCAPEGSATPPLQQLDLISISNIVDWMTEDEVIELLQNLRKCLVPGGAVLMRHETLDPDFFDRVIRKAGGYTSDKAFNFTLHRADRALLTRDIACAWCL